MDRYSNTPEEEKDLAQTPEWFVRSLEKYLRITFDLDVCALERTSKCPKWYSLAEDGVNALQTSWFDKNFCNPPYSDILPWVHRAGIQAMTGKATLSALLIPDKPETDYTRTARAICDTVIHMPFRLQFLRPDGTPFVDKKGSKQGPKFPCAVYLFTPWGLTSPVRDVYHDFRKGKD